MTTICNIHTKFFDETCTECKKEYAELKGLDEINIKDYYKADNNANINNNNNKKNEQQSAKEYKEFTEERAKILYRDLLLQFLKSSKYNEVESSEKAKSIIRKQCKLRNMPFWSWL
jgi:Rps23 Pro-64 3,4-dihydroxylase Tpa1-like proline 4-hydroxylase